MTTLGNPNLHNPHLDGDSFFLPAGPTGILLSHGYTATAAEVRLLAEKLHEQGYTVAGPLLPGHGTSPQELNRTNWQEWVKDGQELLDRLFETCEQVWVGGESMGGVLALYLAAKNPKVKGLLLYAPAIKLTMTTIDKIKLYLVAPFIEQNPRSGLDNPDKWQGYPAVPLKGVIQLLRFQKATL
ncbi:MAG: alpha/beta fold hydrolase, partial [Anaerolineales bacterium]